MKQRNVPVGLWFVIAGVLSIILVGVGAYQLTRSATGWTLLSAGSVCLVAVILGWGIAHTILTSQPRRDEFMLPLTDRLDQLSILLNLMSEQQLLSDRAISIAYREKDREALRRAVHEEMGRQDWDTAQSLVDEMERAFGNKGESQKLRKEISDQRESLARKQINESVQAIDKHTRAEQWGAAIREAEKLIAQYPDNEGVKNLPHEIDNRRVAVKKQLMQNWHEAVARHDNDGSIEILKQLDTYLTRAEAESMQETVRGVYKEKLNELGSQFGKAVKENRIADALRVGDTIIEEFPNTRMAQEVRDMVPELKRRLSEVATVGV